MTTGISEKAIEYFADKSAGTAEVPCHATVMLDATDINAVARLQKTSDPSDPYQIIGGEEADGISSLLGLSDTASLQSTLNENAVPILQALDHQLYQYDPKKRVELLDFFRTQIPILQRKIDFIQSDFMKAVLRYHKANGAEIAKNQQRVWLEKRFLKEENVKQALGAGKTAFDILSNGKDLTEEELVYALETLKMIVLVIAVASTHFLALFLMTPDGSLVVPVARVYFDCLGNDKHAALLEQVRMRLPSNVRMGAITLDGEHRTLMTNTAQARARSVIDQISKQSGVGETSVEKNNGNVDVGGGGDGDAGGDGGGDADDLHDDDESEIGDDDLLTSPRTLKGRRSKLEQAKETVQLCNQLISSTLRAPLQNPNMVGFSAPYSKKTQPVENGAGSGGENGLTAGGNKGVAQVQGLGCRRVRARLNGMVVEPPSSSSSSSPSSSSSSSPSSSSSSANAMSDDNDDDDVDDSPHQGQRISPDFAFTDWLLSKDDDDGLSFDKACALVQRNIRNKNTTAAAPMPSSPPSLTGGRTTIDRDALVAENDPVFAEWVKDVNTGASRPLLEAEELLELSWVEVGGADQQPAAAQEKLLLSARVRGQLTFVERLRLRAEAFLVPAQKLEDARLQEDEPLSKMKMPQLKALLNIHKCSCSGKKAALITRLIAHSKQTKDGAGTQEKKLQRLVELEEAQQQLPSWKPEMTLASLRHHTANAEFAVLQQAVLQEGFVNPRPKEGGSFCFYDVYHLLHNMVIGIIFGNETGPREVLDIGKIRAAAIAVGCPLLVSIVHQKVDKHSHMATHFFLTNKELTAQLRKDGHLQDAVILETLGRAAIAWLRPGKTERWRTNALHVCNLLIHRLSGRAMRDVDAIRGQKRQLGFTCNQLMDLLAINEARSQYLENLSPAERAAFKETALTTRYVESYFSRMCANKGSGEKLTQHEIQGVVKKLDAILVLLRTADKGFTAPESRRKRKFIEGADENWNSGEMVDKEDDKFDAGMKRAVKGYISGRTSIRQHNSKFKKERSG